MGEKLTISVEYFIALHAAAVKIDAMPNLATMRAAAEYLLHGTGTATVDQRLAAGEWLMAVVKDFESKGWPAGRRVEGNGDG